MYYSILDRIDSEKRMCQVPDIFNVFQLAKDFVELSIIAQDDDINAEEMVEHVEHSEDIVIQYK